MGISVVLFVLRKLIIARSRTSVQNSIFINFFLVTNLVLGLFSLSSSLPEKAKPGHDDKAVVYLCIGL